MKDKNNYKAHYCRFCDAPLGEPFLELGKQPLANNLVKNTDTKEFECDLSLVLCSNCKLTQLSHVVPPDLMFKHYLYVSSTTKTFREHFKLYAKDLKKKIINNNNVVAVDIGSNDGLLVKCYMDEGMKAVGVDPAENLAKEANSNGIPTINQYFDAECVDFIINKHGKADIISANNVFAHVPEILQLVLNVKNLLKDDGVFVVEFPYYLIMQRDLVFDMIYHEHVSYLNLAPLNYFFNKNGLKIFDVNQVDSHGGSLRVYISWQNNYYQISNEVKKMLQHENDNGCNTMEAAQKLKDNVFSIKNKLWEFINDAKKKNKKIAGYGAPAKASTIINFCKFTSNEIDYIVDDNPLKQGMLIPGAHIPIQASNYILKNQPDLFIIFAWNFAKEIVLKNKHLKEKGIKFIAPIPEPQVIN